MRQQKAIESKFLTVQKSQDAKSNYITNKEITSCKERYQVVPWPNDLTFLYKSSEFLSYKEAENDLFKALEEICNTALLKYGPANLLWRVVPTIKSQVCFEQNLKTFIGFARGIIIPANYEGTDR